ncbi:MAG: ROK family protein [Neoaquamicrobium sediminum]|uniref:ROK family protein n=1 Tax=Neoaquamicrobium sediminum TaxID=1849104 RepID=UPI004037A95A
MQTFAVLPITIHTKAISMVHGSLNLLGIDVSSYSLTLKDGGGFIGDRASGRAFFGILDELRSPLCRAGTDPFGGKDTDDLSHKDIDKAWRKGDAFAAGLVHTSIEEFAQRLAEVVRAYRNADENWAKVTRIVVGGGLRDSRIGEIAIGRTTAILRLEGVAVDLVPIKRDPDEAALIGGLRLIPCKRLRGCSQMLAVDIGGSSIRAGLVNFSAKHPHKLAKAAVVAHAQWKYGDEQNKPSRDEAIGKLAQMIDGLRKEAGDDLAEVITVACPGRITPDGDIRDGAQNLPGNWEAKDFNLPATLAAALDDEFEIVLHNDAVVQGLSEADRMKDVRHWAVVTIGTGLGNAAYRNTAS